MVPSFVSSDLLDLTEKGGQGWNLSDDYDSDSDKDYHLGMEDPGISRSF